MSRQTAKPLLFLTLVLTLDLSLAQLKYDDDVTTRQLHLEDIENEEEQRLLQQTQQLPLPPSAGTKYFAPVLRKSPSHASQYRNQFYDVEALTARSPPAVNRDFEVADAQRLRLNLHGIDYNDISAQQQNADYYAEDEPLLQQYRSGAANDGYALKQTPAAYVLVPPFGLHGSSDARKQAPYQQQQYAIDPYVPNEPSTPAAVATLQLAAGGVQYLSSNNLRELTNSVGYERRPALEYGVPDTSSRYGSRRPKQQSNQRAYAPQRSESGTLAHHTIPYPPSFISITTSKPQYSEAAPSFHIPTQAPPFNTFAQPLPVPDFFAQRFPKSLLDSYIPSWVIHEMLQQHRLQARGNQLAAPYKRYFKRAASLLTQKNKAKTVQSSTKKSLSDVKDEAMVMTA